MFNIQQAALTQHQQSIWDNFLEVERVVEKRYNLNELQFDRRGGLKLFYISEALFILSQAVILRHDLPQLRATPAFSTLDTVSTKKLSLSTPQEMFTARIVRSHIGFPGFPSVPDLTGEWTEGTPGIQGGVYADPSLQDLTHSTFEMTREIADISRETIEDLYTRIETAVHQAMQSHKRSPFKAWLYKEKDEEIEASLHRLHFALEARFKVPPKKECKNVALMRVSIWLIDLHTIQDMMEASFHLENNEEYVECSIKDALDLGRLNPFKYILGKVPTLWGEAKTLQKVNALLDKRV